MKHFQKNTALDKPAVVRAGLWIFAMIAFLIALTSYYVNGQSVITPLRYYTFNSATPSVDSIGTVDLNFAFYGCQYTQSSDALVGKCLDLGANGNLIHGGTIDLDTALTVELLIKPGHGFNNTGFIRRGDGYFDIRLNYPEIYFATNHRSNGGSNIFDELKISLDGIGRKSYGYYTDNEWHHLVFRFSGTSGKKEVWVDGQLPAGFSKSVATGYFENPGGNNRNLYLNHLVDYLKYFGSIDEVAIYNRGIPAALIYKHYIEAQQGKAYSFVNDYTQPIPGPSPVTAGIDLHEFPVGHPNPTQDVVTQLKSYPVPRYKPGHTLHPNFQWIDPTYFGGRLQPGVSDAQAGATGVAIQTELAKNFNYMLQIGASVPSINNSYIALANQNPQWKVSLITYRAQIGTKVWSTSLPSDHYLQNSSGQFIDMNGTVGNKTWRPTAPLSSYTSDGQTQRSVVSSMISGLTRKVDFVNENGEVFPPYQNSALAADPQVTAAKNASGLSWEDFLANRIKENDVLAYRDEFMNLPQLQNATFTEYRIDGHRDWQFRYEQMKYINTPINGKYYSTCDFYPRWPSNWKNWQGPWHGIKWVVESRYHEIQAGDKLFSPYVAAGWDENPEVDVRPAQWLGLLKCLGMLGAEFYYSGYFNEAPSYMPPNPPPNNPRGYAWQAATPPYAQAITSRYEEVLRNGNILEGDLMNDYTSPTSPGYQFSAGDPRKVVMVRKKDNSNYYAITGTIQANTNMQGNVEPNGLATIKLNGQTLSFNIRKQGSTYIYDRTNPSAPVFYQLDEWHESTHPSYWSRDYALEAELYDNTNASYLLKTSVPAGTPVGDYTNFTTCVTFPDNQTTFIPVEYQFIPRDASISQYHFWVRARTRSAGQPTGMSVSVDNGAVKTIDCISDTSWAWYRFEGCTQQAIVFGGLTTAGHVLKITPTSNKLEIDRIVLTADAGLTLSPAGTACTGSGSASVTAGGPTTFCQGGNVTLTASSGTAYQWSNGATSQSITVTNAGAYVVTVSNGTGCSGVSSPVNVTINNPVTPVINTGGPTTFCQGGSVTLSVNASGTYAWLPGGQTTQSITVNTAGSYSVTVTDAAGCSAGSSPVTVTVSGAPTASIAANGATTFCQGESVTLTASAANSYLWQPGGQTTQSISATTAGSYTVQVSNSAGCTAVSAPTTVSVNTAAIPVITPGGTVNISQGQTTVLTASSGNAYLWTPTGATTQSITTGTAGNYRVSVTDANGCSATSGATTVNVMIAPPVSITASGPTAFCTGDSVQLTASAGVSVYWLPGLQTTQSIWVSDAGTYTVNASNGTSAQVTVTVLNSPLEPSITVSYIPNTAYQLTAYEPSAVSYQWSTGSTQQTITVSSAQTVAVTAYNTLGCASASQNLHVTQPVAQPCAQVTMLTVSDIIDEAATLAWNPAATADSFLVSCVAAGQTGGVLLTVPGNVSSKRITGLTAGTVYNWNVRSYCGGTGITSLTSAFTTLSGALQCGSTPINTQSGNITESSVLLEWYSTTATTFRLRYKKVTASNYSHKERDGTTGKNFSYLFDLMPGTTYEWSVRSECNGITSLYSPARYFTTAPLCDFPGPAEVQEVTHKNAKIAWNALALIDSLKIVYGIVGDTDVKYKSVAQASSNGRTKVGRLMADTDYFAIIKSKCNHGGRSEWLDTLYFHTLPAPVLRPENPMQLNAYPNPARDFITFAFETEKGGEYKLKVADMAGRELYQEVRYSNEGENSDGLSLKGYASGIYLLIIEQGPLRGQFRVAIQ